MILFNSKKKKELEEQQKREAELKNKGQVKIERAKLVAIVNETNKRLDENIAKAATAKRNNNALMYKQYAMATKIALTQKVRAEQALGQMDIVSAMTDMTESCKAINASMGTIMDGVGKFLTDPSAKRAMEKSIIEMNAKFESQQHCLDEWQMQLDSLMPSIGSDQIQDAFVSDPVVDRLINERFGNVSAAQPDASDILSDSDLQDTIARLNKIKNE